MSTITLPMLNALATAAEVKPRTFWLPEQASTAGAEVDFQFYFITYMAYFFFALITILLIVFIVKYRRLPTSHAGSVRGPTHNGPLELTWTIIPLILVIVIFYMGFRAYVDLAVAPKNAYQIDVTAQQWDWSFKYPNGATSTDMLVIPAGRPVKFVLRSNDVIHSFFVPQFRVKQDVVPGRYGVVWLEAPQPTGMDEHFWLFCTEYCGKGHSNMNKKVHVLAEAEFAEWVERQSRWIDEVSAEALYAVAGPRLYARCAQCHTLNGVDSNGPSWGPRTAAGLPDLWTRTSEGLTTFTDGTKLKDLIGPGKEFETPEDYIRQSILVPGRHLVQGFGNAMPTFQGQLTPTMIDAIIGMMRHLDEFDASGKPKPGSQAEKLVQAYEASKAQPSGEAQ